MIGAVDLPGPRAEATREFMAASQARLAARVELESNAKLAFGIWAHRTGAIVDPWERLPEIHRLAWREIIEFFVEENPTCSACEEDLVCVNRKCELFEGGDAKH